MIIEEKQSPKVYTMKMIQLATMIASPVAGFYLVSRNYKALGNEDAARKSLIAGVILSILLIPLIIVMDGTTLPEKASLMFFLVFNMIALASVNLIHKPGLDEFIANGGDTRSWLNAIGITALVLVLIYLTIFVFAFFQPPFDGKLKTYGIQENQIYYDAEIPVHDIDEIARGLSAVGLFTDEYQYFIEVRFENPERYVVKLPTEASDWVDSTYIAELIFVGEVLEQFVPGKKIGITLLSSNMISIKELDIK